MQELPTAVIRSRPLRGKREQPAFVSRCLRALGILTLLTMGANAYAQTDPTVTITAPADGFSTNSGNNIPFQANATDFEDDNAVLTATIAWSSSIDGGLGTGGFINVNDLSVGTHTITASVTDSGGGSDQDTISVTINNVAPSVSITNPANGTSASVGIPINFQASATDVEDGNLAGSVSWTSSRDGNIGGGGSISVDDLSVGTHTITASVSDSNGGSDSDSISVTIVNNAPTVSITNPLNGTSVPSGTDVNFVATANDPEDGDVAGSITWSSSIDGGLGNGGSISVDDLSVGSHTITALATDGEGANGSDSITVTITNNAPVVSITNPGNGDSRSFGTNISFRATASDTEDGNLGSTISWSSSIDGAMGTGSPLPFSALSVGTHTITAAVTDSDGLSGSDTITLTITNNAPTVTITAPATGSEFDAGVSVNFQANAADQEDGDLTGSIQWSSSLDGALGNGGSISVDSLSVGTHTITASATDSDDSEGSDSISVTINNLPPVASDDGPFTVNEGGTLNGTSVLDNDSDPEDDPLTAALASGPGNAANFTLNPNGTFVYVHDGSETTTDSFTYRAEDPSGQSEPATVTIDITPVNDPPRFTGVVPPGLSTPEDSTLTIVIGDLQIADPDSNCPAECSLTLDPNVPANANYTLAGPASVSPALNFNGNLSVRARVSDGEDDSALFLIPVTVESVNDNPVVLGDGIGSQNAVEDSPFTLDVSQFFDDVEDGENLDYTAIFEPALPPERGIQFDGATGRFSGAPDFNDDDPEDPVYQVTIRAAEPEGEFVDDTFDLTISQLGRANLGLEIAVTPDTATPSDELRWTFTTQNPIGPVAGENVILTGSFLGEGLAVGVESGASCTISTQVGRVDFNCNVGPVPVAQSVAVVLSTTTTSVTEVVAFATSEGAQRIPIDPNPANNTGVRAVGVATAYSNGATQFLGQSGIRSLAAGDVNGDGALDIVAGTVSGEPVQIYLGAALRESCNCQRDFEIAPLTIPDTGPNEGVALADFDNNGTLDIVIANNGGQADEVFSNDGAGNFSLMAVLLPSSANDVAIGDFDNDGNADIAIAASSPNLVYFGDGNGNFGAPVQLGDDASEGVAAGRFNADNLDDLVFANAGTASRVYTKNAGAGFSVGAQFALGSTTSVAAADLNNDGFGDIVFGRTSQSGDDTPSNPVFFNNASGAFGAPVAELGLSPTNDVLVGDVNEDGQPDIVFVNQSGVHQIWVAAGGGFNLHAEQIIDIGAGAGVLAGLGFADAGDPGGTDLALGGVEASGVGVYLNDSAGNLGLGDAVPPELALVGESTVEIPSGDVYVDEGATASDNIDGDLTASVVVDNPVNTALVGAYTVTYDVTDFAGNVAMSITRTVNVTPASGTGGGGGGGGAVSWWLLALGLGLLALRTAAAAPARARSRATRHKRISG